MERFAILRVTKFGYVCLGVVVEDIDIPFVNSNFPIIIYPIFSDPATTPVGFKIPKWLMPSPWHVISLKLDGNKVNNNVSILGIHMDTF